MAWTNVLKPAEASVVTQDNAEVIGLLMAITSVTTVAGVSVISGWTDITKPQTASWISIAKPVSSVWSSVAKPTS